MSARVGISDRNGETVGHITFDESPKSFHAYRNAGGFVLNLPLTVSLMMKVTSGPWPMLSNLAATLYGLSPTGSAAEVGRIRNETLSYGGVPECSNATTLVWVGRTDEMVSYERLRNGNAARFNVEVSAELCYLVPVNESPRMFRTEPHRISGTVEICYPAEVWTAMLHKLGLAENVLVEIPLPIAPPGDWEKVWAALLDARDNFERGGSSGWRSCVISARVALERWREIDKEDRGPSNPRERTRKQRLDNLRVDLFDFASLWAHHLAQECTRDDALLVYATLASLLAQARP